MDSPLTLSKASKEKQPDLINAFLTSFKYSAIQAPLDGATQLIDKIAKTHLTNDTQFFTTPKPTSFGSSQWVASTLGNTLGMMIPSIAIAKFMVSPLTTNVLDESLISQNSLLGLSLKNATLTGLTYGSVFTPSDSNKNFLNQRINNGITTALSFAVMTGTSLGLNKITESTTSFPLQSLLKKSTINGALSGLTSSIVSSESNSLLNTNKLASIQQIKESMTTLTLLGGFFGGLTDLHNLKTTSANLKDIKANNKFDNINDIKIKAEPIDNELYHLSTSIADKFNTHNLTDTDLETLTTNYSPGDKAIAEAILAKTKINMSDKLLMKNLAELGNELRITLQKSANSSKVDYFYTLTPDSAGNVLAYLTRKANNLEIGIHSLDYLKSDLKDKGIANIVLFDNLSKANPSYFSLLKTLKNQGHNIFIIDTNNFSQGLSFIDLSKTDKGKAKLDSLVQQAQLYDHNKFTNEEIAHFTLNMAGDSIAKDIGATIIRPTNTQDLGTTQIHPETVYRYLKKAYPNSVEALTAANLLAKTAQYNDLQSMTKQLTSLHEALLYDLGLKEIKDQHSLKANKVSANLSYDQILQIGKDNENKLLYVIGVDGGDIGKRAGSSGSFISHIYKTINDLPSQSFVSEKQLKTIFNNGELGNKHVVYLDDTAYEGVQLAKRLRYDLQDYPVVTIGLLGSYDSFVRQMKNPQDPNRNLVNLVTHFPLKPESIDDYIANLKTQLPRDSFLSNEIQSASNLTSFLHKYDGYETYSISSYQVWPYFTADNATHAVRDFSQKVLGIENARNQDHKL